jgi:MFS transporter, MHS family, proline/betaine transporter
MDPRSRLRLVAAGTIGNVLEWYDFAIYGYFAISIGLNFFPQADPVAQVLAAFGVFAVGYIVRPLGGAFIGTIADRYGRRTALIFSVTAMAVPTFLVGVLPGYETLGIMAPVLLTLLRMIQGLSVGGESATAYSFLIEQAPTHRRGLAAAVTASSSQLGMLLGSGSGALLASILTPDSLHAWGWRIPFLCGLFVGAAGYLLRRHVQDTAKRPPVGIRSPLLEALGAYKRLLLWLTCLAAFSAVGFYLMFLYVVSWLQLVDGVPPERALSINTASMVVMIVVMLAAGWLSDKVGPKPLLLAAVTLGFLAAVPLLWLMHHSDPALILVGQMGFVLVLGPAVGVQSALMVSATPPAIRCTAMAIGLNLSYGLMGGLSPLAATWLVHRTGMDLTPALMIMAAAAVTFAALLTFKEGRKT